MIDFDGKIIEIFNSRRDRFAQWQETSLASIDTSGQDEEELRKQAYNFQVNDVRSLRDLYKEQVGALFDQIALMKAEFEAERAFFVAKAEADNQAIEDFRVQVETLSRKFAAEKVFTDQMFVKAEVGKICSRALYKFDQDYEREKEQSKVIAYSYQQTQDLIDKLTSKKDKYKNLYKELRQEFTYEKRLSARTIEVLEDKVSSLLADHGDLKNSTL